MDYFELLKEGRRRHIPTVRGVSTSDDDETLDPSISLKFFSFLLCQVEDCALTLQDSAKRLSKFAGRKVASKEALIFLSRFRDKFLVKNVDGAQYIEAKTDITLCDAFQSGKCKNERCKQLHICRFFLQDSCDYGDKCNKGHSFTSPQTSNLLAQHKLEGLPVTALRNLFKNVLNKKKMKHASQSSGAPKPCSFYNKESGCKNGDKCQFLHVCEHFVSGDCSFGVKKCKRDHHFSTPHSKKILATHGLGQLHDQAVILVLLRMKSRSKSDSACSLDSDNDNVDFPDIPVFRAATPTASAASSTTPAEDKLEICGFNLRGKCNYGDKCNALHTDLPYQWEYSNGGQTWSRFEDVQNKSIEKAFCDYGESRVQVTTKERWLCLIDFQTLTGKLRQIGQGRETGRTIQIRRLSTVSSVAAVEGHVFRTKWKWYWQDENDKWRSYDDIGTDTTSEKIELDYLSDSVDKQHRFSHGSNKYYIYMNDPTCLYQQNIKYKTKRNVRRRPARFVDREVMRKMLEEFKLIKCQMLTSQSDSGHTPSVPAHWAPLDPSEEFQLIRVKKDINYDEYSRIKQLFKKTMSKNSIKSIKRVQNSALWEDFQRQKSRISKKNSGHMPEERFLFHGTNEDTVHPICQQGFDWRLSGKHGTRYGKGSYFATDASYSHNYTRSTSFMSLFGTVATSGTSQMFLAKVIVGSYVVGDYQTTRPPPKDKSNPLSPLHDSCVDNLNNPTIFVVFERSQAYPYYIIEYQ